MDGSLNPLSAPATASLIAELDTLYQQSKFRSAWDLCVAQLGDIRRARDPALRLLIARILSQLGYLRLADAMVLRLKRSAPGTQGLNGYYIPTLMRRKGPLVAYEAVTELMKGELAPQDRVDLYIELSDILCEFRDFAAAETLINSLPTQPDNRWLEAQRIDIKIAQDDYKTAMTLVEALIKKHPDYRHGIQQKARLLELNNQRDEAIACLEAIWQEVEQFWLGRQLLNLYVETQRFAAAEQCLQRIEALLPFRNREIDIHLNFLHADLLCAQQKYEQALPYLQQKNPFQKLLSQSIQQASDASQRKILNVPFVRQAHMTCAPASLTAVAKYWGVEVQQEAVIEAICYDGTSALNQRKWLVEQGWGVKEFDLNFASLKLLIDRDMPVLLSTVEPGSAHLQIIVGYDEVMGTYLIRDPFHPRLLEMLIKETGEYYASSGPRCMLMLPLDQLAGLEQLALPNAELYEHIYEIERQLSLHQREAAGAAFQLLSELAPQHRLRHSAERTLAFYDRDEARILATTQKLLDLFPRDVNFQLSKISSLLELGATVDALSYLESLAAQPDCHFLIKSRYLDQLRGDDREQEKTAALTQYLLRRSPLHAPTLYSWAGILWDQQDYEKSAQIYRFITCLEDTNEGYAESYFKAARFRKETEKALLFLKDRFQRFGKKSSGPIISLYYALDSLERTQEALDLLNQGLFLRPEDGHLLLFAAKRHLECGEIKKAKILLQRARPFINQTRFDEVAAAFYEADLDKENATLCWLRVAEAEPLNYAANNNVLRLFIERGERDKALQYIDEKLARFPGNISLQQFKIQSIEEDNFPQLKLAHEEYLAAHPKDIWALRSLSNILLNMGDIDGAISAAEKALSIDRSNYFNHASLGCAWFAKNELAKSKACFEQALRLHADYTYAFERLLDCCLDDKSQREALAFIHAELMRQVSYGDGILEFQRLAWRWLDGKAILEFMQYAVEVRPDLWQSWLGLALTHRKLDEQEKELEILNQISRKFPFLPRIHAEKAECLRLLHRDQEAIDALRKTLELSPNWISATNKLCELIEKQGDFEQILAIQSRLIQKNPLASTPWGFVADVHLKLGQTEQAIEALNKALERDINYRWAWRTLYQVQSDQSARRELIAKLRALIARHPDNTTLLDIYSDLEPNPEQERAVLQAYLNRHPRQVDICVNMISACVRAGDMAAAMALTTEAYWQGQRPVPILANEARLQAEQHNYPKAIQIMEEITRLNPHFYDAWRYLVTYYETVKNAKKACEAAEQCVRIYPHDPAVLCFAAEKLERNGGDKKRVAALLRHSFELDVGNQHNALTYIDYLFSQADFEAAASALDTLEPHHNNFYTRYRRLQLAVAKKDQDAALASFDAIIVDSARNDYIIRLSWEEISKLSLNEQAASRIAERRQNAAFVNPGAGRIFGEHQLATLALKKVEKELLKLDLSEDFNLRYAEAYIRHAIGKNQDIPGAVELALNKQANADTTCIGLIGYLKYHLGKKVLAKRYFAQTETRSDVDAWMLYFYSVLLREQHDWNQAKALIQRALTQRDDGYQKDILVWSCFDRLIDGEKLTPQLLEHVELNELAPISAYIYRLCSALFKLGEGNFAANYRQISPELRRARYALQKVTDEYSALFAKRLTKNKLSDSLADLPLLKRLFWQLRLFNNF